MSEETAVARLEDRIAALEDAIRRLGDMRIHINTLDPTKANVLLIGLPNGFTRHDVEAAQRMAQTAQEAGVKFAIVHPQSWQAGFVQTPAEGEAPSDAAD